MRDECFARPTVKLPPGAERFAIAEESRGERLRTHGLAELRDSVDAAGDVGREPHRSLGAILDATLDDGCLIGTERHALGTKERTRNRSLRHALARDETSLDRHSNGTPFPHGIPPSPLRSAPQRTAHATSA